MNIFIAFIIPLLFSGSTYGQLMNCVNKWAFKSKKCTATITMKVRSDCELIKNSLQNGCARAQEDEGYTKLCLQDASEQKVKCEKIWDNECGDTKNCKYILISGWRGKDVGKLKGDVKIRENFDFRQAVELRSSTSNLLDLMTNVNDKKDYCSLEEEDNLPLDVIDCLKDKDSDMKYYKEVELPDDASKFELGKKDGEFYLRANLRYLFGGDKSNHDEVVKGFVEGKQCAERFFRRYRINAKITFSPLEDMPDAESDEPFIAIGIRKFKKRPNSLIWSLKYGNGKTNKAELCGLVIHELGHRLGLPDRYEEEGKKNKVFPDEKGAIMAGGNYSLKNAYFTEEDLKILTKRVCPNF